MPGFKTSEKIRLPPRAVFDYVTDIANSTTWLPGVVASEMLTEGPIGAGSRYRETRQAAERMGYVDIEVKEYDPPRKIRHGVRQGRLPDYLQLHLLRRRLRDEGGDGVRSPVRRLEDADDAHRRRGAEALRQAYAEGPQVRHRGTAQKLAQLACAPHYSRNSNSPPEPTASWQLHQEAEGVLKGLLDVDEQLRALRPVRHPVISRKGGRHHLGDGYLVSPHHRPAWRPYPPQARRPAEGGLSRRSWKRRTSPCCSP